MGNVGCHILVLSPISFLGVHSSLLLFLVFCISGTSLICSYKLLQYYTESATGYIFRSLRDVIRYLETGDVGIHVSKPKKICTSAKDSTDNKLSVSLTCMLHYPSYFHVHLTYISSLSILIALQFFFLKHYNVVLPKDPALKDPAFFIYRWEQSGNLHQVLLTFYLIFGTFGFSRKI